MGAASHIDAVLGKAQDMPGKYKLEQRWMGALDASRPI